MNSIVQVFRAAIGLSGPHGFPPFTRWLGGVLREVDEGALTMQYTVREEMANPVGYLHGGVQNAMIDDLIGMTVATLGREEFYFSVNLSVDYLRKVKVGEQVVGRARIVRGGRRLINAECELVDSNGELIARGTSNLCNAKLAASDGPEGARE